MKRFLLFLRFSIIILAAASCKSVLMKMEHVKAPALESKSSVLAFLKRYQLDKKSIYTCRDSASCVQLYLKFKNIPEAAFFNSRGEMLIYSDSSCPGKAANFASQFVPGESYRVNHGFCLKDLGEKMAPLGKDTWQPAAKYDLTVVIFWAVYCGKINRNGFEIMDVLNNKPGIKVQVLLLNMDFLKEWGMRKKLPVSMDV
ncbi:MAG: hypothetical protein Q8867_08660 [Bacteroidota bacterium]|nr:hypothetical protein [Bacteroidota bacterium]